MRILIISDTHRKDENVEKILKKEGAFDRVIHLGDVEGSQKKLTRMVKCPMDMGAGNNDMFGDLPKEKELELCGHHILLTHGHYYYVSLDTAMLGSDAGARGFDIVLYGHTHRPKIEERGGVILANPGSVAYPRQEGRKPSYIIMKLEENGETDFEIKYLDL